MTHVVAVTSIDMRDNIVQKIRQNYIIKFHDRPTIRVIQERLNKIVIYDNGRIEHTVIVVIIPILCNLDPLFNLTGEGVHFNLGFLYDGLKEKIREVDKLRDDPTKLSLDRKVKNVLASTSWEV